MQNVVGYVRVSTQGQARDGYSLQYAVDEIIKYCEENNLNLISVYEDQGISGAKVDEEGLTVERESLQNMLADLSQSDIQSVIVLNTMSNPKRSVIMGFIHVGSKASVKS